jgi:hypothetical protein
MLLTSFQAMIPTRSAQRPRIPWRALGKSLARGGWVMLLMACLNPLPVMAEDNPPVRFDHVIDRIDRLEFYRIDDFGPPGSACHACSSPQHVNCQARCYSEIPSLSLICSQRVQGLSIGPFDRAGRGRILEELFRTDTITIFTDLGEESLDAPSISSESGDQEENYAIDIKGLDGFKNALIRASSSDKETFNIKVGTDDFMVPLNPKIRDGLHRFIRQCPD